MDKNLDYKTISFLLRGKRRKKEIVYTNFSQSFLIKRKDSIKSFLIKRKDL